MVPLDLRWVKRGRPSLLGLLVSSVSVEVLEVFLDAGGVGRVVLTSTGSALVMDGIEEAWKGSKDWSEVDSIRDRGGVPKT